MYANQDLLSSVSLLEAPASEEHLELSRVLAAAVVNPSFCQRLLVDPQGAIENGCHGETFQLTDAERYTLLSFHASSLAELAQRILQVFGPDLHPSRRIAARAPVFMGV